MLGPWTGAKCGWAPCPPATKYLTNLKSDRLISCHVAGWLAICSWQSGWLTAYHTKCQPVPSPRQGHLVVMCVATLVTETCGQMYPLLQASSDQEQYYIRLACHLVSIWVRLTCLFEGTSDAQQPG